jgi:hypothetical protein
MNLFPPYFIMVSSVFIANQLLERAGIFIPFVHSYLDDMLAIPIVLGFTLVFQQQVTYRNPKYTFAPAHVVFMVVLLSVYFEWHLPSQHDYHYADPWDVLAYALGGFAFFRWMNVPAGALIFVMGKFPFIFIKKSNAA